MKTTSNNIILAAGAIAQLAAAQPHLAPRDYVTEIEYATVVETVTAGAVATSAVVNHANWRIHQHTHHRSTKTSSTDVAAATSQSSVAAPVSSATTLATSAASSPAAYTLSSYANTFSTASSSATSTSAEETSVAPTSSTAVPTYSPSAYGASTSSSSSPTAYSSSTPSATGSSTGAITSGNTFVSNGIKAGLSGFVGIADTDKLAFDKLAPYIGWYSDYTPVTPNVGNVVGVPMLWGSGSTCLSNTDNTDRLEQFKNMTTAPGLMFGFYEPDCDCPMSSDMSDAADGASSWNDLIAPLATNHGTKLGSPSMCKQKDEDWLTPFKAAGLTADWDVTSIHINVKNLTRAMEDVEYYVYKYNKPIWISEFACVDDTDGFTPCMDQAEIDQWLKDIVPYFQWHPQVVGYGASNGEGLNTAWPLTDNGELSLTGQTYLQVLQDLPETMKTFQWSSLPTLSLAFNQTYLGIDV